MEEPPQPLVTPPGRARHRPPGGTAGGTPRALVRGGLSGSPADRRGLRSTARSRDSAHARPTPSVRPPYRPGHGGSKAGSGHPAERSGPLQPPPCSIPVASGRPVWLAELTKFPGSQMESQRRLASGDVGRRSRTVIPCSWLFRQHQATSATVKLRLTSERSLVRTQLRPPEGLHASVGRVSDVIWPEVWAARIRPSVRSATGRPVVLTAPNPIRRPGCAGLV